MKPAAKQLAWFYLAVAATAAGCTAAGSAMAPRQVQINPPPGRYESAVMTYRLGGAGSDASAPVAQNQQVSYGSPAAGAPSGPAGKLMIQYPHPEGKPGYALAELVVEPPPNAGHDGAKPAWQRWSDRVGRFNREHLPGVKWSDAVHEAWSLDIPKADLDLVLKRLEATGYFRTASGTTTGADVTTCLDGNVVSKRWIRLSEFDVLAYRVRDEGKLASCAWTSDDIDSTPPPVTTASSPLPQITRLPPVSE